MIYLYLSLIPECVTMNDMNIISSWAYNIAVLLTSPYPKAKIAYDNLINLGKEDIKVRNNFGYIILKI